MNPPHTGICNNINSMDKHNMDAISRFEMNESGPLTENIT